VAEVEHSQKISEARNGNHLEGGAFWDAVVRTNILSTMHVIREQSPLIWQKENNDTIKLVGCIYHLENGKVEWIKE
jgi:carbonic anhydrase